MVPLIKENQKMFMGIKWTDREYHVQDNAVVEHQYVKMYCNRSKFPALPFCDPYSKPHGARGLSKHYHFSFDTKLGNDNAYSTPFCH